MSNATLIAYIITALIIYLGITNIPQVLVAGFLTRLSKGISGYSGGLTGGIISWLLLAWGWKTFEGGTIPIVVFVAAFAYIGMIASRPKSLNETAYYLAIAEMWAIVIVAAITIYNYGFRWY